MLQRTNARERATFRERMQCTVCSQRHAECREAGSGERAPRGGSRGLGGRTSPAPRAPHPPPRPPPAVQPARARGTRPPQRLGARGKRAGGRAGGAGGAPAGRAAGPGGRGGARRRRTGRPGPTWPPRRRGEHAERSGPRGRRRGRRRGPWPGWPTTSSWWATTTTSRVRARARVRVRGPPPPGLPPRRVRGCGSGRGRGAAGPGGGAEGRGAAPAGGSADRALPAPCRPPRGPSAAGKVQAVGRHSLPRSREPAAQPCQRRAPARARRLAAAPRGPTSVCCPRTRAREPGPNSTGSGAETQCPPEVWPRSSPAGSGAEWAVLAGSVAAKRPCRKWGGGGRPGSAQPVRHGASPEESASASPADRVCAGAARARRSARPAPAAVALALGSRVARARRRFPSPFSPRRDPWPTRRAHFTRTSHQLELPASTHGDSTCPWAT
ncbi:collagen alpha-1(I) chain-like [Erinaceus europaeus]|uniref:Collagen alpha-1(I) chain-like n=1 Tax=Erinaceus europaeus TaxID=9365 RepID=A0ABM3W5H9_ERIEU|nr:collagen alpha-1(I) chain-like [Erinaceus europaeus]